MANVYLPDAVDTSIGSPVQSSWGAEVRAAIEAAAPAGEVGMICSDIAPDGWLTMIGQTVTSFQTLYPSAWPRIPSAWKSGSSVTFPDTRARIPIGAAGYGDIILGMLGGANEAALTIAQLPVHNHGGATGVQSAQHTHPVSGTSNSTGSHAHGFGSEPLIYQGTSFAGFAGSGLAYTSPINWNGDNGTHNHTVSGTASASTANHTHTVAAEGTGAAISRMQAHFVITFMMRVY